MKMEPVGGTKTGKMTREEVLRRAEALVPVLRERAPEAEKLRRCPDSTIADYIAKDLLRICMPARFGGFELGYDIYCETVKTLARGCGSQAWVHMVLADNALKLAFPSRRRRRKKSGARIRMQSSPTRSPRLARVRWWMAA